MVRDESHCFTNVLEAPSNETAGQIFMDPAMRSTAPCGQEMESIHKAPMRWHMFSRCSFLAIDGVRRGIKALDVGHQCIRP